MNGTTLAMVAVVLVAVLVATRKSEAAPAAAAPSAPVAGPSPQTNQDWAGAVKAGANMIETVVNFINSIAQSQSEADQPV